MTAGDLVTKVDLIALESKVDKVLELLAELRQGLPTQWLTVAEAARHLHCQAATVRAMADRGDLRSRRAGRKILVASSSLHGHTGDEVAVLAREARA